jgi:small subunit ribosomal protein S16
MVKLRFIRIGKKHQPAYRLVAIKTRTKRDGEAIEFLGQYNPRTKPTTFTYETDRVKYWLSVGAQPTDTVRHLLAKDKLVEKLEKKYTKAPGKKASAKAEKVAAEAEAAKAAKEAEKEAAKAAKEEAKAAEATETEVSADAPAEESTEAAS